MKGSRPVGPEDVLLEIGSVRLGRFKLSSGGESSIYIDLRLATFKPRQFKTLIGMAAGIVEKLGVDAVAGVATGGIPWSTGIGLILSIPSTYVRPKEKGYGTSRRVEADVSGLKVAVIDDVATTGSSILGAVEALRLSGATVEHAVVIVERSGDARKRLAQAGVKLYSLTTLERIIDRLGEAGHYSHQLIREARMEVLGHGLER
ncbi:MAG: orotate phosphoribosyltransferase [Desulfurococcales archaeon]|nr:orotate phosphoribosyltransferase [Desulfurococcales archaeon]MCE4605281.1 orotate phosphoribosyltransferase [Desulfurococcales archaeon]